MIDCVTMWQTKVKKYECVACGYIYDPEKGDPENGIEPGTAFDDIPEDLAVGVAFGAVAQATDAVAGREIMLGGIALAIGIGLQNFPEGLAVAMPLRREGLGRFKAFMYGQASGVVEPLAGVLGAWLVMTMESLLPYGLAFAAGAMIFVVVEELIPESQRGTHNDFATVGAMVGFAIMMTLDVGLG